MAYLGNLRGPAESLIVENLGHEYFGITARALATDIEMYLESERRNEVQPVHVDNQGRPYILVSRSGGRSAHLCLEAHGWILDGSIRTWTETETDKWLERLWKVASASQVFPER